MHIPTKKDKRNKSRLKNENGKKTTKKKHTNSMITKIQMIVDGRGHEGHDMDIIM